MMSIICQHLHVTHIPPSLGLCACFWGPLKLRASRARDKLITAPRSSAQGAAQSFAPARPFPRCSEAISGTGNGHKWT